MAQGLPPRWRLPLLALGFVSLALGVAGGLARLTPALPAPTAAIAWHGPLMVSAFFGTVIALERATALDRLWAYAAPSCAGLGGLVLLLGFSMPAFLLMVAAAAALSAASLHVVLRQPSLETATLLAGAVAWLAGNFMLMTGGAAVPWWMAFLALTIGGERLELSRYLRRAPWVRYCFAILALVLLLSGIDLRIMGVVLVLALWLCVFDLARVTVRQEKLPRYVAVCLLAGYFWLAVAGAGLALELSPETALHAFFVGFVFSMVFGHAPVILPAVLRVRFPYSPVLYGPLLLLHLSLAARTTLYTEPGAWGNAAAIALFIATAIFLVFRFDPPQNGRAAPR